MCDTTECVVEYIRSSQLRDTLRKYPNPLYRQLQCGLLTSKKSRYYVHKYTPSPALDELTDLTGVDLTSRKNCCRCVSISLYYTKDIDFKLYMYLANIIRTVGNVKKYLPDWIVRLYIDPSVFRGVMIHQTRDNSELPRDPYPHIVEALECLFKAENVEMYTYFCDDMDIGYVRSYRFLPMIDPEVAAYAVREADGIVSVMDCNNLDTMVELKMPMYLVPYINNLPCLSNGISYQWWLVNYKESDDYFNHHTNVVDLLAGTFSSTIKIQPDHYYKCVGEVVDYLSRVKDANFALDEILLLRTFRDLICIDYEKLPDSEFYGGGKKRSAELIRDTAERLAILIDGELEVDPIYDTYSFVYRKRLTISLNPTKGPFNLPNLLCTPEQLQELIAWYDNITSTVEDLALDSGSPSSRGYLFYQMIERLIGPSDNIIDLKILKGTYTKRYMKFEISTKQLVNASHITTWCSGIRLYKNSYFAICDHNGLKLMDLVRAKTKQVVGDAYLQKRIQKVSTL